jgi:hypothetical protein
MKNLVTLAASLLLLAVIGVFDMIAKPTPAFAGPGGMCPAGTCAPSGGRLARDTDNCKASHCSKLSTKGQNCQDWYVICLNRPVLGVSPAALRATCDQRKAKCVAGNGCFEFNSGGPQCGPVPAKR